MACWLEIWWILVLASTFPTPGNSQEISRETPREAPIRSLVFSFFSYWQGATCQYECPNGAKPQPVPDLYFAPSGCGSYHLSVNAANTIEEVKECCNQHDMCYGQCLNVKDDCDRQFQQCLTNFCNNNMTKYPYLTRSMCLRLADLGFTTVQQFGCEAFKNDQEVSCVCPENDGFLKRMVRRMKGNDDIPEDV